jgi:separase
LVSFASLFKKFIYHLARKLCERHAGVASDGVSSISIRSCNLEVSPAYFRIHLCIGWPPHEYMKLGKMKRVAMIFKLALGVVRSGQASLEAMSAFLLRSPELLALVEDASRRYDHPIFF